IVPNTHATPTNSPPTSNHSCQRNALDSGSSVAPSGIRIARAVSNPVNTARLEAASRCVAVVLLTTCEMAKAAPHAISGIAATAVSELIPILADCLRIIAFPHAPANSASLSWWLLPKISNPHRHCGNAAHNVSIPWVADVTYLTA